MLLDAKTDKAVLGEPYPRPLLQAKSLSIGVDTHKKPGQLQRLKRNQLPPLVHAYTPLPPPPPYVHREPMTRPATPPSSPDEPRQLKLDTPLSSPPLYETPELTLKEGRTSRVGKFFKTLFKPVL